MTNAVVPVGTESIDKFIRRVMFKNVDPDALNVTLLMCQRYDLDPLLKHVVVIKFGNRHSPYITRDGLLHVAHRSGELDGMSVSYGTDDDGDRYAEATVYRKGHNHPFVYRAYASEYDTKQNVWKSHPKAMLGKTAEVIALRRAFDVAMNVIEEMDRVVVETGAEIIEGEILTETTPEPPAQPQDEETPAAPVVESQNAQTPEKGRNGAQKTDLAHHWWGDNKRRQQFWVSNKQAGRIDVDVARLWKIPPSKAENHEDQAWFDATRDFENPGQALMDLFERSQPAQAAAK